MPSLNTYPCQEHGCGEIVPRPGLCRRHRSERIRAAGFDYRRRPARIQAMSKYGPAWRAIARQVREEEPVCRVDGCGRPTQDVDHIVPLAPPYNGTHERSNLQGLCRRHHRQKTAAQVAPYRVGGRFARRPSDTRL